jgi:hypothetical protein
LGATALSFVEPLSDCSNRFFELVRLAFSQGGSAGTPLASLDDCPVAGFRLGSAGWFWLFLPVMPRCSIAGAERAIKMQALHIITLKKWAKSRAAKVFIADIP